MAAKWKRMWGRLDNQEVSLEAATLERKRNSSLVEWLRAENITGLKLSAEAADSDHLRVEGVVGERSSCIEGIPKGVLERLEVRMLT